MGHRRHQHTPYEAPDSLRSAQRARIVDLLAWGTLSPGNGDDMLRNIYLDGTPVRNPDGSYNHKGVSVEASAGTPDQLPLEGFGGLERLVDVGAQVKNGKPITRTIADPKINRLRITVAVGALVRYKDNGDILETSVELVVTVGSKSYPITFNGKSMSAYSRDLVVDAPPGVPFTVTVSRPTPDSTTSKTKNDTYWRSIVEIIDTKENYAECAVVGLALDSDQFGGRIPKRSYLVKNTSIQIPSNYDPYSRSYSGTWDGRFKTAWTDNPAWCFYHLLTDKRYGLGGRVEAGYIDKWSLYEIGRYCDVLVDDGKGGTEPRMTCNAWLSEAEDAKKVLDKVASCFRGIAVWDGNAVRALQDRPHPPVALYGNANVVDGRFSYSGVPNKSITTAAEVSWLDPARGYEPAVAYYQDDNAIKRYGRTVARVEAFGCTSPGQARRYGRWMVETSVRERRSVTFTVGREGLKHTPFDIIEIADNDYAGAQLFGRVVSIDGRKVTLDRDVPEGNDLKFRYQKMNEAKTLGVTDVDGRTLTLERDPEGLKPEHPYALATDKVAPRLFRCISIAEEEDDGGYTITAITHDPHKEAIVDQGAVYPEATGRTTAHAVPTVFGATVKKDGDTIVLSWDSLTGYGELSYQVAVTRNNASYRNERVSATRLTLANLAYGEYRAVIRACNSAGQVSDPAEATWSINLKVTSLRARPRVFACYLSWQLPELVLSQAKTEIWHSDSDDVGAATKLAAVSYPNDHYLATGLEINEVRYYWVRMVDSFGNAGVWTDSVKGKASDDPDPILKQIQGSITKTELHKELAAELSATEADVAGLKKGTSDLYSMRVVGKTEDGKPIVGGITIGVDGKEASSEILMQADKFMLWDSKNKQAMFSIADGKAAINGDLIASGTILGEHIAAHQTIKGPKIEGGTIKGATINANQISCDGQIRGKKEMVITGDAHDGTRDHWNTAPQFTTGFNRGNARAWFGFHEHVGHSHSAYVSIHWDGQPDKVWEFRSDGHLYGPPGRYVTDREVVRTDVGALNVGSFLIFTGGNVVINQLLANPDHTPRDNVWMAAPGTWKVLSFSDTRDFSILQRIR